jgi:hypothetical protein
MSAIVFAASGDTDSSEQAWSTIEERASESSLFVQPIVDALLMEGYMQFTPPCYCEAKVTKGGGGDGGGVSGGKGRW